MPKGIYEFFSGLESLAGVEAVDSGRFIPRNKVKEFNANIQFYDESRRTFRVRVAYQGFITYPVIRISPEARESVEDYIRNYNPDGNKPVALPVLLVDSCYGLNQNAMAGA